MQEFTTTNIKDVRAEVWLRAWLAVAVSNNCSSKSIPIIWADSCLEEFDKKFPQASQINHEGEKYYVGGCPCYHCISGNYPSQT